MQHLATKTGVRSGLRLRLRFSERRLLLTALDLIALFGALTLAQGVRLHFRLDWTLVLRQPLWFVVLALIWLVMAPTFDAYEPRVAGRLGASVAAATKAVLAFKSERCIDSPLFGRCKFSELSRARQDRN